MATIDQVLTDMTALSESLKAVDTKLDDIRSLVTQLRTDIPVTQEQLNQLSSLLDEAKTEAASVLSEASDIG